MLFFQGTRDTLAQEALIKTVVKPLSSATLVIVEGADHSFKMLKSTGITLDENINFLTTETLKWLNKKLV